jgi:hypothetical protein
MIRSLLSAVALAGILATAQSASADPSTAAASDHAKAARVAAEQPTPQPAWENSERDKNLASVGFGWG